MSNREQYYKLWQQKRNELPVDKDPDGDWLDIQGLLDQQMPVIQTPAAGGGGTGGNLIKQLTHLAKYKLVYIAAAVITAATVTYVATQNNAPVNNKSTKNELLKDSLSNNAVSISEINSNKSNQPSPPNLPGDDLTKDGTNNNVVDDDAVRNGATADHSPANKSVNRNVKTGNSTSSTNTNASTIARGNIPANKISAKKDNNIGQPNSVAVGSRGLRASSPSNKINSAVNNASNNSVYNLPLNDTNSRQGLNNGGSDYNTVPEQVWPSLLGLKANEHTLVDNYTVAQMFKNSTIITKRSIISKPVATAKVSRTRGSLSLDLDWGIFTGVTLPGSFTPKKQNSNFYGSLPVDIITGAFITNHFNDKWSVDAQLKLLVPNNVSEVYDHTYTGLNDTGKVVSQTFRINDTRKIYSAQIPLHVAYNVAPNIAVKAGPVVNIPLKFYRLTTITPVNAYRDTVGYVGKLMDTLASVKYDDKVTVGISGGLSYTFKRLRLEATYYYNPQPTKVISQLTNYCKRANNLQITIGFKLNKSKP